MQKLIGQRKLIEGAQFYYDYLIENKIYLYVAAVYRRQLTF
jgi:hypothetical protein